MFRNYLNGDKVFLSPEKSIELQRYFGADLIFVLDECTPFNVSKKYTENSMYLSHRWAKRCLKSLIRLLILMKKILVPLVFNLCMELFKEVYMKI